MAQRIEIAAVSCPANTPQANAIEVDMSFDPGNVARVDIVIPDGHAGVTGLALAQAHQVIIPASGSAWIVGNDELIVWPLQGYLNNGSWSAFAYNLDPSNAHAWYLRFLVNELGAPAPTVPAPLPVASIMSAGSGG